jgi:hypothetical protein
VAWVHTPAVLLLKADSAPMWCHSERAHGRGDLTHSASLVLDGLQAALHQRTSAVVRHRSALAPGCPEVATARTKNERTRSCPSDDGCLNVRLNPYRPNRPLTRSIP